MLNSLIPLRPCVTRFHSAVVHQTLQSWVCEELAGRSGTAALLSTEFNLEERCKQVEPVDQSQNEKHAKTPPAPVSSNPSPSPQQRGVASLTDSPFDASTVDARYVENNTTFNKFFKTNRISKLLLWIIFVGNYGVPFSLLQSFH